MSSDPHSQISAKYSQLAALLVGPASVFTPTFWNTTNVHVVDDTVRLQPTRDNAAFNGKIRFELPKRPTGYRNFMLEVVIAAGVAAAASAAYVNNLGDQLLRRVVHRYGNTILHEYDGEYQQLWQRYTVHEVDEEARNALTLGGLPLAATAANETQRAAAVTSGITVYCPLDRLWCVQHHDEMWTPEAYGRNGEIEIDIERLEALVYTGAAVATNPFAGGTTPTISSVALIVREVTLSIPEKQARLQYYERDEGFLIKFLDLEKQASVAIAGLGGTGSREYRVKLDNFKLDMQEFFFIIRRQSGPTANQADLDTDWSGDKMQPTVYDAAGAPVTSTLAPGGRRIDMMIDGAGSGGTAVGNAANPTLQMIAWRLESGQKRLTDNHFDLPSRCWNRKFYHPRSQPRSPIWGDSFSLYPEETKDTYGFQNASNQGNLELVLTMSDFPTTYRIQVDVYAHSHNTIQSRRGDCVKTMA